MSKKQNHTIMTKALASAVKKSSSMDADKKTQSSGKWDIVFETDAVIEEKYSFYSKNDMTTVYDTKIRRSYVASKGANQTIELLQPWIIRTVGDSEKPILFPSKYQKRVPAELIDTAMKHLTAIRKFIKKGGDTA